MAKKHLAKSKAQEIIIIDEETGKEVKKANAESKYSAKQMAQRLIAVLETKHRGKRYIAEISSVG